MEEPEKMSPEEAKRVMRLVNKILRAIDSEENYTYQDVMRAMNLVGNFYEKKGHDLLNNISIQEVGKFGALLD